MNLIPYFLKHCIINTDKNLVIKVHYLIMQNFLYIITVFIKPLLNVALYELTSDICLTCDTCQNKIFASYITLFDIKRCHNKTKKYDFSIFH